MKNIIKILLGMGMLLLFLGSVSAVDIKCSYDDETYNLDDIKANDGNVNLYTGKTINIPKNIIEKVEKENVNGKDRGLLKEYVGEFKTKYTKKIAVNTKNKLVKKGKYTLKMSKRDYESFKKYTLKKHKIGQGIPSCLHKFTNKKKIYDEDTGEYLGFTENLKNVKFKVKILKKVKTKELYQMQYGDSRDYRVADGYQFVLSVKKYKPVKTYKKVPIYGRLIVNNVYSGGKTRHYNYLDFVFYKNGNQIILESF